MSQPLSAPAALSRREDSRGPADRPEPVHVPAPAGPAGGYAAISIGRWWQGGRGAAGR